MSPSETTFEPNMQLDELSKLKMELRRFADERDWNQFHSPKNLAMALSIEAAELMEHFQWLDTAESRAIVDSPQAMGQVADELADVICYALSLANVLHIDVSDAVLEKLRKNALKYPTERYRGRYRAD